jgi:hypothetical protein
MDKKEFQNIITFLLKKSPFYGVLLKMRDVYFVPTSYEFAWTDGKSIFLLSTLIF